MLCKNQTGLSLVELMIAMSIGLLITSGIISLMINSKRNYTITEDNTIIQENMRFAFEFISRDMRQSGYGGCMSRREHNLRNLADSDGDGVDNIDEIYLNRTGIVGEDNTGVNNSDTLTLQFGEDCNGKVTSKMGAESSDIILTDENACNVEKDKLFLIADCESSDLAYATDVNVGAGVISIKHATALNISDKLSKAYGTSARILTIHSNRYYIANNVDGNPSLFRDVWTTDGVITEELIENVENLQVLYGEDFDNDNVPNTYVSFDDITDIENIVSLKTSLLIRGADNMRLSKHKYNYVINKIGTEFTANDKRTRRPITFTVSLRNK